METIKIDVKVDQTELDEALAKAEKLNTLSIARELKNYKTCELVEELKNREGVEEKWAEPYKDLDIKVQGPAVVLVVID